MGKWTCDFRIIMSEVSESVECCGGLWQVLTGKEKQCRCWNRPCFSLKILPMPSLDHERNRKPDNEGSSDTEIQTALLELMLT